MKSSQPGLFDKLSYRENNAADVQWREVLLRDVENLLNDAARSGDLALEKYGYCETSVLNYGLPSLSKQIPISADALTLAQHINKILSTFEPRLDPRTIQVKPVFEERHTVVLAILFDISGIFSIPGSTARVNLRIALDYSCGAVQVL